MQHDESELVAIAARAVDSLMPQAAVQAGCKEYAEHIAVKLVAAMGKYGNTYAKKESGWIVHKGHCVIRSELTDAELIDYLGELDV